MNVEKRLGPQKLLSLPPPCQEWEPTANFKELMQGRQIDKGREECSKKEFPFWSMM
jgi:hypothetical protein